MGRCAGSCREVRLAAQTAFVRRFRKTLNCVPAGSGLFSMPVQGKWRFGKVFYPGCAAVGQFQAARRSGLHTLKLKRVMIQQPPTGGAYAAHPLQLRQPTRLPKPTRIATEPTAALTPRGQRRRSSRKIEHSLLHLGKSAEPEQAHFATTNPTLFRSISSSDVKCAK